MFSRPRKAAVTAVLVLGIVLAGSGFGATPAHAGNNPADVIFVECTDWQRSQFAVIPEGGGAAIKGPRVGVWYRADGIWVKGVATQWIKLPGNLPEPSWYAVRCSDYGYRVINGWPGFWPWIASWEPAATSPVGYPF